MLGCFVTTIATAVLLQLLNITTVAEAATLGVLAGMGYAASVSFVNAIMPKIPRPFLYGAITGGYHTAGIVLAAIVIVAAQ